MKFLKTFFGLFCALYIPLMLFVGVVMKPRDPKMSAAQAALGAAPSFALIVGAIALGYAVLTFFMDRQKAAEAAKAEAEKKALAREKKANQPKPTGPKRKKRK